MTVFPVPLRFCIRLHQHLGAQWLKAASLNNFILFLGLEELKEKCQSI